MPENAEKDDTLQAIMELQRSFGKLEAKIDGLADSIAGIKSAQDETRKKVSSLEKVLYAAGIVLAIWVVVGGWMLNTAKDAALTYFKTTVEAQAKTSGAPSPGSGKPAAK